MANIRFEKADLQRFAAASHDRNPLHLSEHFARRSAFGEPIVFGILSALGALASQPERVGQVVEKISITFRQPLVAGVNYQVEAQEKKSAQLKLSVIDAGSVLLVAVFSYGPGASPIWQDSGPSGIAPTAAAVSLRPDDLAAPLTASGRYAPEPGPFGELARDLKLARLGLSPIQAASLLWSSYLVGMELPGERAIFSRFEITFRRGSTLPIEPILDYEARTSGLDDRFDLLEIEAALRHDGESIAEVKISSFVRRETPEVDLTAMAAMLPRSETLKGKLALVVGGSRGLGAAIAAALVTQGCDVLLNYRAGAEEAIALKELLKGEAGSVIPCPGDAADSKWGQGLRDELTDQRAGLDFLVANASPPIRMLGFTPDSVPRFRAFVDRSLALTSNPLAACLDPLANRFGLAVLVSSSYASVLAEGYPSDLVHYVAAKYASEGLVRALASQRPSVRFLIVRPPKLLTDQTNTSSGRQGAIPVEGIAATIVGRMLEPSRGGVDVLESFLTKDSERVR